MSESPHTRASNASKLDCLTNQFTTIPELKRTAQPKTLCVERVLTFQAMLLLIRLDRALLEARAQWNQDWFRRVMRVRKLAVRRLQRRWSSIQPPPKLPLGKLRRRHHPNIALFQKSEDKCQFCGS